jgi:fido (protein-threonine AMPylation protein)
MRLLTKYDVLIYLSNGETNADELISQIKQNALFEKTHKRKIMQLLSELRKDGLAAKNRGMFSLTGKSINALAFLLWAKKDGLDYNIPLRKRHEQLFRKIFETGETELIVNSMFSKPTTLKIARQLDQINFTTARKRKPLIAKANTTDMTLFFANAFNYDFDAFQKCIKVKRIEKDSPKLKEQLIKLHVYSTTVTEGNTATEKDVERVLNNLDSQLSPREVIEIINAKKAVDELYRIFKTEELSIEMIKKLHRILMTNLVEQPGEFSYTGKRIIGSPVRLPGSKLEIDSEIKAVLNFYEKYKGKINPLILAPIVHLLFVSIHPFIDGNGRVARLMHSFILMKTGLPLFAFDPNYWNNYFDCLDKGRAESIEDFVQFCIDKHNELLEKL